MSVSLEISKPAIYLIAILVGITILGIIILALPEGDLPSGIATTLSWISQQLVNWDFVFPIGTTLTIISYIITIEILFFTINMIIWITNLIKGQRSD